MGNSMLRDIEYGTFCGEKKEGETQVLRHPTTANGELRTIMHLGCETMWDAFEYNFKVGRANHNFCGYRKKIKKDELENKYTWITFEEANKQLTNFSKGLRVMNLCPLTEIPNDDSFRFLGIYSRNKPEWLLSYFGAVRDSVTVVTIYETLGDVAMEFIFNQTQLQTVVAEIKAVKKLLELAKQNRTGKIKNIIALDKEDDEASCKELETLGINVYTWEEVAARGEKEGGEIELIKPKPETISTINYTSGTTGNPKGAKIKHQSIILNTDVIEMLGLYLTTEDTYLSFLPYAHIMETLIMAVLVTRGVAIGIYNGNAAKLTEDAQILHPSTMCTVPRIFQRVFDGIKAKLNKMSPYKRKIFNKAIEIKMRDYKKTGMLKNAFLDNLVFKPIREILGGRMRFMLCGSAPLDGYLLNFLRCSLSCEIVEGYGQTEDCAGILLCKTYDPVGGHIGGPGYSAELKLVDKKELEYTSSDIDPETGKWHPRGELCVRGPVLFTGYLSDPEKTKEAVDEDGWLHTGDVCMIIPEHGNAMKIIDRVKNIFKLQQGEYVAPEKIENILGGCKYVEQIFVYGDSLQSYLVGILVPNRNKVIEFLQSKGISEVNKDNFTDYYDNLDLKKEILKELDTFSRNNGLKGFEIIKNIHLCKEPFTVDNQIMTPTMKIKRHNAKKIFKDEIKKLYEEKLIKLS